MKGWTVDHAKLYRLRIEARLTPKLVAERAGCHWTHYHKLEKGQQPSADLLFRILEVLGSTLGRRVELQEIATENEAVAAAS